MKSIIIKLLFITILSVSSSIAKDGDLDSTFGTNGKVITNVRYGGGCNSLAIQKDSCIILGGVQRVLHNYPDDYQDLFFLVRYKYDGSIDEKFGNDGFVQTYFGNNNAYGTKVLLQEDNKILLSGITFNGTNDDFAIVRYNNTGSIDTTFGINGKVITDFYNSDDRCNSAIIQKDGKIILGGYTKSGTASDFALARYNENGSLDTTFGVHGKVNTDCNNSFDYGNSIVIQLDGKILICGNSNHDSIYSIALVRYNPDGTLDNIFGVNGILKKDFGKKHCSGNSVVIQQDGKIIIGGITRLDSIRDFILIRYNFDGTLDNTFGINGIVVTSNFYRSSNYGNSIALQADGKILLLSDILYFPINDNFLLLRYNINGNIDSTFGNNGYVDTDFGHYLDNGRSVLMQPDGKILAAGSHEEPYLSSFELARYHSSLTVGVKDILIVDNNIQEYPIPSSGMINIKITSPLIGNCTVNVYNILGHLIYSNSFLKTESGSLVNIDLSGKETGTYFYQIVSPNSSLYFGKFIIIK